MTREELLAALRKLADADEMRDTIQRHQDADRLLLEYINDEAVTRAFDSFEKWYA